MSVIPNRRTNSSSRRRAASDFRAKRGVQRALERLEERTLLTYTFSYNPVTKVATAVGNAAVDSLVIEPVSGFLEYSVNGSGFSGNWGGNSVPADPAVKVNITLSTGNGSSLQLGTPTGPASELLASFFPVAPLGNTSDTLTIDDSTGTVLASPIHPYSIDTQPGTISGPGFSVDQGASAAFVGGVTLKGSAVDGDIYNVLSILQPAISPAEPFTIVTGGGVTSTVNVGNGGTLSIGSPLAIYGPGAMTTVNINDASDTTHATATLDNLSGNASAPFELTGLSHSPIEYGAGVTALNINGGTNGGAGVAFVVNNTQAGTTTTINGGANANTYSLGDPAGAGLNGLLGPVVINGGASGSDTATLDDSNVNASDNYTLGASGPNFTVTRTGAFAGLTYNKISTLTLNAENTLATNGNNTIDVNTTPNGQTTTINGQNGTDTVNVNGTGTGGTLNVNVGDSAPATVNLVGESETTNVNFDVAGTPGVGNSTVNVGAAGGTGDLNKLTGPIKIVDIPNLYDLFINDQGDATGQTYNFNIDNASAGTTTSTLALAAPATFGGLAFRTADVHDLTFNGGSGGNTVNFNTTVFSSTNNINAGAGSDTVNVQGTGSGSTTNIDGQAGTNTVTLGGVTTTDANDPGLGAQSILGTVNVSDTGGTTALTVDDSQDTTGQVASLTGSSITGLSPGAIHYTTDLTSLTVNGGSGGNTFTVNGTVANPTVNPTPTTLNTGTGDDNTTVLATTANTTLAIHGQNGRDTVLIGDNGKTDNIDGAIFVDNASGLTDLTVNASADTADHNISLSGESPATLTNLSPAPITYTTGDLNSLTLDTGPSGNQTLNLDFGTGNPIPAQGFPGLTWNAGANAGSAVNSHVLNISGTLPSGAFTSEVHNAEGDSGPEHHGDIVFTDSASNVTSLLYTGLQPINDTATATNYTFNDLATPDGSFNAVNGPAVGGFTTIQFNSASTPPGAFETTNIANKTNVVFNANNAGVGVNGTVNITTPSDMLKTLQFNTNNSADNTVSFQNVPAGVATSYNGGTEEDTTNVTGMGVPSGNTLTLNGGANIDTLNYNAGGLTPTVTAGANPGEVLISLPGFGTVDATNYENINITNVGPLKITPGPARTINSIEDFQLVDAIVGTFQLTLPPIISNPAGVPASDFTATIDWGDPSPDNAAGTITQDASNPSVYYITGTHTFTDPGTYTVGTTIAYNGSPVTATVNGVNVGVTFSPLAPVAGAPATANVTNAAIAVSAYPIVGVEGSTIPAGPIASFIDAGGSSGSADPSSDFTAAINVIDSTGTTVLTVAVPSSGITQQAASNSYVVNAPALSLAMLDEGTYALRVTVTKMVNGTDVSATGGATAVLSDAALAAGAAVALTPSTGVLLPNTTVVGNFTDANTNASATDFTAVIDWGDGSATSLGTVAGSAGTFTVAGGHRYARPGSYATTIVVTDDGGSHVTLTGTATVTDQAVVAGNPVTIRGVEGQSTGTVVLGTFTDPNTLATASDVSATLSAWGDGTPTNPVPVAVQLIGSGPNGSVFEILGSHTYLEETAAAGVTITMTVTTSGGKTTPITATAIIADAPLSASGAPVSGIEGNSTGTVVVATFSDADPNGTATDYTATITWGDGHTSAGTIALVGGSPNGVTFSVSGSNTYAEAGSYPVSVSIVDAGGAQTVAHSTATIKDAALAAGATQPTVTTTEGQPFSGPVATFTDANPTATASDFNYVLIDWGDGTPMSIGTVTGPTGGPFTVAGTHTYANTGTTVPGPGTSPILVQVHDVDGATLNIANSATVNVASSTVTGQLNPASDTGLSTGTPNVTSVQTPNFFGTVTPAIPGETVTLIATNAKGQTFQLGRAVTNAAGDWNLTSGTALPTGTYAIRAVATDPNGNITSGANPVTIVPSLVIDNVGPVVQNVTFDRSTGTVLVTYADAVLSDGSPGSGVSLASITDAANYMFTRPHTPSNRFLITGITPMSTGVAGQQEVALTINNGRVIRGGFNFNFTIFATNNARPSGVEDLAENGMQGVFYGTFPSGNGINGTNFNARLVAFHNRVLPAMTNVGTAHPMGTMTMTGQFAARRRAAVTHAALRHHH